MEYTVQKLARLAGISARTIRYYDEIGILKPARINSSGYRIYGALEVDRLQQILFYRELGVDLDSIKNIVTVPSFDEAEALKEHREKLLVKRQQLELLIRNVERTIALKEGRITMSDKEKFAGFKENMIDENEKKYGEEIRQKYGNETVDKSNAKLMNMTEEEYNDAVNTVEEMMETLEKAMEMGDPSSELAQKAAELHKKWLTYYWPSYSKEAHAGVTQMYVDDERFTAYYDERLKPGTAEFLRDAVWIFTGMKK